MKNILVVTTFSDTFNFFSRLSKPFKDLGYNLIFYTNKYSNYLAASTKGHQVIPIKSESKIKNFPLPENFLEVKVNELSLNKAVKLNSTIQTQLEKLHKELKFEYILLWGGVRLIQRSVRYFARNNKIKTIFFELGNFPNKVFIDPLGTNADSLLARNKSILNKLNCNLELYRTWKENYISKSLQSHKVPQSSNVASIDYKKNLLDLVGFKLLGFLQNSPVLTFEKLSNKILGKKANFNYDTVNIKDEKYIFYPMQVSDDAQIVINSSINNNDALKYASEKANELGLKLLVKPHPAERNIGYVKEIEKLKDKLGFYFVNGNTIELIKESDEVITINSTVGLQAKILEKNVTCLGKAFYKDFSENDLASYITSYLFDLDFWGKDGIKIETVEKILERANLNE